MTKATRHETLAVEGCLLPPRSLCWRCCGVRYWWIKHWRCGGVRYQWMMPHELGRKGPPHGSRGCVCLGRWIHAGLGCRSGAGTESWPTLIRFNPPGPQLHPNTISGHKILGPLRIDPLVERRLVHFTTKKNDGHLLGLSRVVARTCFLSAVSIDLQCFREKLQFSLLVRPLAIEESFPWTRGAMPKKAAGNKSQTLPPKEAAVFKNVVVRSSSASTRSITLVSLAAILREEAIQKGCQSC